MRAARKPSNRNRQQDHRGDFVELRRMTSDAVAEIDPPRQSCRRTVSQIAKAGEKAADSADANPDRDRQGEKIPRARSDSEPPLRPFHRDCAAQQAAHDCFSAHQYASVAPVCQCEGRVFETSKRLAAEGRAHRGRGNDGKAGGIGQRIAAPALMKIHAKCNEVSQAFKNDVRVQRIAPYRDFERKMHCAARSILLAILPFIA